MKDILFKNSRQDVKIKKEIYIHPPIFSHELVIKCSYIKIELQFGGLVFVERRKSEKP